MLLDPLNKEYILRNRGVELLSSLLNSADESIILSVITSLMFLVTPNSKKDITSPEIIECVLKLSTSENHRIQNLAKIFLKDYCGIGDTEENEDKPKNVSHDASVSGPSGSR